MEYMSVHVFVCMFKCFHSCLSSRDLWFWHLKMWAVKTKPPPFSSGSTIQNKCTLWRYYTGQQNHDVILMLQLHNSILNIATQWESGGRLYNHMIDAWLARYSGRSEMKTRVLFDLAGFYQWSDSGLGGNGWEPPCCQLINSWISYLIENSQKPP